MNEKERYTFEEVKKAQSKASKFHTEVSVHLANMDQPAAFHHQALYLDLNKIEKRDIDYYITIYLFEVVMANLTLETSRCYLRHITSSDAADLFEVLHDDDICDKDGIAPYEAMDERYLHHIEQLSMQSGRFAIVLKESNKVIGFINATKDRMRSSLAIEIGYSINRRYHHLGIGTEVLKTMVHLLLDELEVDMVTARVFESNVISKHLLEKCGFICEGLIHHSYYHELHGPYDCLCFYQESERLKCKQRSQHYELEKSL